MFGRYEDITKVESMLTALSQLIKAFLFRVFIVPSFTECLWYIAFTISIVLPGCFVIHRSPLPPYHQLDELSSLLRARGGRVPAHLRPGGDAGGAHSCGLDGWGMDFKPVARKPLESVPHVGPAASEREASRANKRDKHLGGTQSSGEERYPLRTGACVHSHSRRTIQLRTQGLIW